MTNHPEAALRALITKWRSGTQAWNVEPSGYMRIRCADELAAILRQLEAAPSTPDSSQGERVLMGCDYASEPDDTAASGKCEHCGHRVILRVYTTPPPSSPQVALPDGFLVVPTECPPSVAACIPEHGYPAGCKVYTDAIKHAALHVPWLRVSAYSCAHEAGGAHLCNEWCRDEKTCPASYSFAAPQAAPKAAEPVEPQARHWRQAITDEWDKSGITVSPENNDDALNVIEQRARSLAQAEQAAKGDK